jgi:hypothetical protein
LRAAGLVVGSRELGNGRLEFRHARAAVPAGHQMVAYLSRGPGSKFAVRRKE